MMNSYEIKATLDNLKNVLGKTKGEGVTISKKLAKDLVEVTSQAYLEARRSQPSVGIRAWRDPRISTK